MSEANQLQRRTWFTQSDIGRCRKCGKCVPCTRRTASEKTELLFLTVNIETKHPVEGYCGSKFWVICMAAWSRKDWKFCEYFFTFLRNDPSVKFSKLCSESFHLDTDRRSCVQISWNVADGKSVKSCVIYLTRKIRLPPKLMLLHGSRPKSAFFEYGVVFCVQ